MPTSTPRAVSLATLMEGGGSCVVPLDAAADYWRCNVGRMLPLYVLAMAPHALVTSLLIAAITSEQRSVASHYCMLLAIATLWRWIWIARMQQRVQEDLRAQRQPIFWSRIPQILLIRLFSNAGISWGLILAGVPAFYGLYLGSFAAPLVLESDESSMIRVRRAFSWIHHSGKRLVRVSLAISIIVLILVVALFVGQQILANSVLPAFLGVDSADLDLTLNGWAWRLSLLYFAFLLFDGFWSVAAVLLYYDSQSRRTATDLKARLTLLTEEIA